jgi:hypothetical protein
MSRRCGGGCEEESRTRARNASARRPGPGYSGQSSLSFSPRRRAGALLGSVDQDSRGAFASALSCLPGFCSRSPLFPLFTRLLALCSLSLVTHPRSLVSPPRLTHMSQGRCESGLFFPGVMPAELAHDGYPVPNRDMTDGALVVLHGLLCGIPPAPHSRSSHQSVSVSATRITSGTLSAIFSHTILRVSSIHLASVTTGTRPRPLYRPTTACPRRPRFLRDAYTLARAASRTSDGRQGLDGRRTSWRS